MSKTIVITGATGSVASQIIPLLTSAGVKVRAVVRNVDKAAALAAQGVALVEGDLDRPRTLGKVFDGADSAMLIAPPGPRAPQQYSSALWAARQSGVKHVVRLSAIGAAHDAPTVNSRLHALSDTELERSNIPYTILKPHFFMQNLFMAAQSVAQEGAIYLPMGDGRMGIIDVADIAAVAAHVLTTPGHENKTYTLTGPRSISMHEVAAAFTEALGRPIQYVPVPAEAFDQQLAQAGVDEFSRTLLGDYFAAYSRNWGDLVTDVVPRLLGRPARSIAEFARAVAPAFGKR
ncbi:SDR family oxidoreductase [Vitiosangium sp. GDMCC 1.1324]|uniref:SDR family oxidoreductase n=1 Tax=Vitiosangium sp. (strain GDMCC 1.1324) TaxID=2138576 RepID=UPI00130EA3C7|nr:SDR family oxidoreductase [Vitiosangium sp. GDMCC 1.1324]